eukprot:2072188-Pleurochrysis_carterae.AAC.1
MKIARQPSGLFRSLGRPLTSFAEGPLPNHSRLSRSVCHQVSLGPSFDLATISPRSRLHADATADAQLFRKPRDLVLGGHLDAEFA